MSDTTHPPALKACVNKWIEQHREAQEMAHQQNRVTRCATELKTYLREKLSFQQMPKLSWIVKSDSSGTISFKLEGVPSKYWGRVIYPELVQLVKGWRCKLHVRIGLRRTKIRLVFPRSSPFPEE